MTNMIDRELTIDFESLYPNSELFTGRKNGIRARKKFEIDEPSKVQGINTIKLIGSKEQLITSSYFLGLLETFIAKYSSYEEAIGHVNVDCLSEYCIQECHDALEYTFMNNNDSF